MKYQRPSKNILRTVLHGLLTQKYAEEPRRIDCILVIPSTLIEMSIFEAYPDVKRY